MNVILGILVILLTFGTLGKVKAVYYYMYVIPFCESGCCYHRGNHCTGVK